jgi:hypothetical protein
MNLVNQPLIEKNQPSSSVIKDSNKRTIILGPELVRRKVNKFPNNKIITTK